MKTLLCVTLFCAAAAPAAEPAPLTLAKTIPLPGVEGRFDHAAYDAKTHRLFFAALGNNTLEVVDVETATRIHSIKGLKKPTGVLFLAEWNVIVVAGGDDGTCRFYDGTSYAEKGRVTGVEDADNLRFDTKAKRIYLGYGEGALGVIDPAAMKLLSSIPLAKHPESFQLEQNGPRIFVNVPDAGHIAVVDRTAGKVIETWPVTQARANFPMSLDESGHRLFVGTRQPAKVQAFDTTTGKLAAESPLKGDVDDLFYDAAHHLLMASCGEGFVDFLSTAAPDKLSPLPPLATADGARTSYWNAEWKWFCIAVPHHGRQAAEIRLYRTSPAK